MKKIVIFGLSHSIGGIETSFLNYYNKINHREYQIDFICPFPTLAFEELFRKNGSKIHKVSNFKKNPFKYFIETFKILKNNNYSTVHINMLSAANILPIVISKKAKIKNIIVHSHNAGAPKGFFRKTLHIINKKYIVKHANKFLACSKLAGLWLFGDNKEFFVINNAIDLENYKYNLSARKDIRKKLHIGDNDIVIGHVGRFFEQKNHDFLIDIFHQLNIVNKKYKLLLIGDGNLKKTIENKVTKLNLDKYVFFTGNIHNANIYYSAMDMFLLPSFFEGSPMVLIEAQTSGLKCYVSDTITKESKIINNVNYFSLNNSAKSIANQIIDNIENIDRDECFKKMTNSKYNINLECQELLKFYE